MGLNVEVYSEMPRKWSKVVLKGDGPVLHDEVEPDQPTMAGVYRMIEEIFDKPDRKLDELAEKMRATRQRLAGLEQDARQPRLDRQTPRLASVRSALQQIKRSMWIAVPRRRAIPT